MTSDPSKFLNGFNQATHECGGRLAIDLSRGMGEILGIDQIQRARKWCYSPLTVRLKNRCPSRADVYARAILHLDDHLRDSAASVANLPHMHAWARLCESPGEAHGEVLARMAQSGSERHGT